MGQLLDLLRYEIRRRWDKKVFRQWMNRNPRIVIAVSLASVFILLMTIITMSLPGKKRVIVDSGKAWFYDLNTGELFTARKELAGPIEAPSGPLPDGAPAGVKACVLTYTNEPNENDLFVGFLEMPDPNSRAETGSVEGWRPAPWGQGKLIRTLEDPNWIQADSPKGRSIFREAFSRDETGRVARYWPPR